MALDPTKNFAKTIVSIGYDNVATSIVLTAGYGALLPDPAVSGAFNLVWWNQTDFPDPSDDPNKEIVRCTARTTDTLTIVRAQESTTASTKNTVGKVYYMILSMTSKMISDIDAKFNALGTMSTQSAAAVAITGGTITGIPDLNGGQLAGFRNKIINGAMQISQRGTNFPATAPSAYSLDRFNNGNLSAAVFTVSQDTTVYPSGFNSSLKALLTTADAAVAAGDRIFLIQAIEGSNIVGLDFGLSTAKQVTLSFWVYSNVVGTYTGTLLNSSVTRSYPFEYTINAANTWEKKTVTLTGDITGTWLTTTGVGIYVALSLMVGSTYQSTANSWQAGNFDGTANQVNWAASLTGGSGGTAPTFYLTGVQFEQGPVATSFEHRGYGTELALCQRYYYRIFPGAANKILGLAGAQSTTTAQSLISLPVPMRVAPTGIEVTTTATDYAFQAVGVTTNCSIVPTINLTTNYLVNVLFTVAAGLTAGQSGDVRTTTGGAGYIGFTGVEL